MLDRDDSRADLAEWLAALPCYVRMSDSLVRIFERSDLAPTLDDEDRGKPRRYCRPEERRAALEMRASLPALQRSTAWHAVYAVNLSRGGCGFVHSDLLFPGERLRIVMGSAVQYQIEIAWCRRVEERCYLAGAQFITASAQN